MTGQPSSMRIWILSQYYPPEVGAAAVRLSRLARMLAADGHKVTILTSMPNYPEGVIRPPYKGRIFYREQQDGVNIRRVWVYATPRKTTVARLLNQLTFMVMVVLRGLFLQRPDVIMVESHPLFVCLSGMALKRLKRAPVVLNVSDLWPESAVAVGALRADSRMVKIASRVERWAYRDACHIIGLTRGVVAGIEAVCSTPNKVTLIQNAVDLKTFHLADATEKAAAQQQLGLTDGQSPLFVASHVGNMSLTYDFDVILNTAETLPNVRFVFVGDGSKFEYIKDQVKTRALNNVILAGVLPHQKMPAVWAASDISLISLSDHSLAGGTLPAKMYEAMASGTPVIAAIRGEGEAVIREAGTGIVIPLGDSKAMSAAIQRLMSNPDERLQMAQAGRAYAEAHFAPERVKQAYLGIFQRAAQRECL